VYYSGSIVEGLRITTKIFRIQIMGARDLAILLKLVEYVDCTEVVQDGKKW
jgi:hypothetical protein